MKSLYLLPVALLVLCATTTVSDAQRRPNVFKQFHETAEKVGDLAPQMVAKDSDGKRFDLNAYRGRWVFIEFGSYT